MATNIIPFESKTLPAYMKNAAKEAINDDLISSGIGFPVISIKGKTFAIVRAGEREILPNPKDPDSPATSIDVVILKANPNLSKIYYDKKYEEGDDSKPVCYSTDGITPNADAQVIQSPKCATCKHNEWGSRITDAGKKGKACQDNKRIAVTTPDQLNEPYLMRVPPASLSNLTEYAQFLNKRGVRYSMVVTKISFDADAATPKLLFKPVGLLDEAGYNAVQEALKLDVVEMIVGTKPEFESLPAATAEAATKAIETAAAKPVSPKVEPVAATKPAAAAKPTPSFVAAATPPPVDEQKAAAAVAASKEAPAPVQVAETDVEVDLDNLNFDD